MSKGNFSYEFLGSLQEINHNCIQSAVYMILCVGFCVYFSGAREEPKSQISQLCTHADDHQRLNAIQLVLENTLNQISTFLFCYHI